MLLSSGALGVPSSSLFSFRAASTREGMKERNLCVVARFPPALLARSSDRDVRSPRNNGISGTDLPPIYYENKQRGLPETLTIYIVYSLQEECFRRCKKWRRGTTVNQSISLLRATQTLQTLQTAAGIAISFSQTSRRPTATIRRHRSGKGLELEGGNCRYFTQTYRETSSGSAAG